MASFLYEATDPSGKPVVGSVDAASPAEAVEQLRRRGYQGIRLHSDLATALMREEAQPLMSPESERLRRLELEGQRNPGLMIVLKATAAANRPYLAVTAGLALYGLVGEVYWLLVVGLLGVALPFLLSLWNSRHAATYDAILREMGLGNWENARRLITRMRKGATLEALRLDLDAREAQIIAREGRLAEAIRKLEPWAAVLAEKLPGHYEGRLGMVHLAAGDYPGYVACARSAHRKAPADPTLQVDCALAEARFGDQAAARALLEGVDPGLLPVIAGPFLAWIRGLLTLAEAPAAAEEQLRIALRGFLDVTSSPATWSSLALCGGALSLALSRQGKQPEAVATLGSVRHILKVYGDAPLLSMIAAEVGPL